MPPLAAGALAALVFGAAIVRGYSGFGFSALVVAGAALLTDHPLEAVGLVLICEVVMTAQAARAVWRDVDWGCTGRLMAGALLGMPLGVFALAAVPVDVARAVVSLFVLAMCAVLLSGWRARRVLRGGPELGVGLVSGLANAAAMAGLPVAAFLAAQPIAPAAFRATLILYFAGIDLITVPVLWQAGLFSPAALLALVWMLPLVLLGNWAGSRQFLRTPPQEFRRLAIGLLSGLAVLGLMRAVL